MIVRSQIRDLWNTSIEGYSIAAVPDTKKAAQNAKASMGRDFKDRYINSGMLLINLDYWRQHDVEKQFISYLKSRKAVSLPDQDTINYVLADSIKMLHPRYNAQASYFVFPTPVPQSQKKYIRELFHNAVIVHFSGGAKPWHRGSVNPYKKDYIMYRSKTPYGDQKTASASIMEDMKMRLFYVIRSLKGLLARILSYSYN